MDRRDFMKGSAASLVAIPTIPALAEAPAMPLLRTPKSADELYRSINELFKNRGHFDQAVIVQDGRHIRFKSYLTDTTKGEGIHPDIDAYFPDPRQAVAAVWKRVLDFKADIRNDWTQDMLDDFGGQGVTPGVSVWWRMRPELIETKNKLYAVRMRAAFT